jgi:ABC-type phosphate transport system permease subunit
MAKTRLNGYSFGMEAFFVGLIVKPLFALAVAVPCALAVYLVRRYGSERVKRVLLRKLWRIS